MIYYVDKSPRTLKIEPYLIYDILVIICMVIIVGSYIIVNFGYNIVSYEIPVIFLNIIFFPVIIFPPTPVYIPHTKNSKEVSYIGFKFK